MRYQIDFNGSATAELTQLLHSVEARLSWQGIRGQGPADSNASRPGVVSANPDGVQDQSSGHRNHEHCLVIIIVVAIVGVAVGYYFGRRKRELSVKTGHG
jgi:hypothetical protein